MAKRLETKILRRDVRSRCGRPCFQNEKAALEEESLESICSLHVAYQLSAR